MENTKKRLKQIVDWRATFIAGFVGGLISYLLNILLTRISLGSGWLFIQLSASILLGEKALHSEYDQFLIILLGFLIHIALSMIFAAILTTIIHRWGLVVGIIGGAAFGLGLYVINFYLLSYFFPWFYPLRTWIFVLSNVLYGAIVGGVYELLEVEKYIFVTSEGEENV